jgi:four helix bundle protein
VFQLADELIVEVYRSTRAFPIEERFGLQSQIRRAAVSVATNLVEGCTRRTTNDYVHFATIALGSASEARYLLEVAHRLDILSADDGNRLLPKYDQLVRSLQTLINRFTTSPKR